MSEDASPLADSQEAALQALLGVIASRDRPMASRLLAESPQLARLSIRVGAARGASVDHFFKEIAHYTYAGDTPLHVAAAAYQRDIAEELVSRGQTSGPETDVAPSRCTTRQMGFPGRMPGTPMRNMSSSSS